IASPACIPFGDWVEQLIAESTGKDGKGILPVVDEQLGLPDVYGHDRLFVNTFLKTENQPQLDYLAAAGFPVIHIMLDDKYDIGGLFFLWEMATVVAGYCLNIQPFNQPNVELAKNLARSSIQKYMDTGELNEGEFAPLNADTLTRFLGYAQSGSYIALQAYLAPSPEVDQALTTLQTHIRKLTKCPVTKGYGPRFLHSTGQLHKGDAGNGLFVQLVSQNVKDLAIPDEPGERQSSMSFAVLKRAQALGDYQALLDVGRRVIRFLMPGDDIESAIQQLIK
ncbi:MAG: hypothetical protein P1S60_10090, partial [Anaerolineae bacterium]|nr:hypothetical protein [Anaerolineae bacterium]